MAGGKIRLLLLAGVTKMYILQALDIHKSFKKTEVLKGITLQVAKGEVLAIIGALQGRAEHTPPGVSIAWKPSTAVLLKSTGS